MTYNTFCQRCRRSLELTRTAFEKFLTLRLKELLEKARHDPSKEVISATITFEDGCPQCSGSEAESEIELSITKGKKH
jgi:hypothetical protein